MTPPTYLTIIILNSVTFAGETEMGLYVVDMGFEAFLAHFPLVPSTRLATIDNA